MWPESARDDPPNTDLAQSLADGKPFVSNGAPLYRSLSRYAFGNLPDEWLLPTIERRQNGRTYWRDSASVDHLSIGGMIPLVYRKFSPCTRIQSRLNF